MDLKYLLSLSFISLSTTAHCWLGPVQVSGTGVNFHPSGVINTTGNAELAWVNGTYPSFSLLSSTYSGGVWSAPVAIETGILDYVQLGIDATGNAVAVWQENISGNLSIQTASKPFGGSWTAPSTLSVSANNSGLVLAMNGAGQTIAVWIDITAEAIMASYLTFGGSWSAPVTLSAVGEMPIEPQVAIDSAGNGYAIWTNTVGYSINAAVSSGAVWGPEQLISLNGSNVFPDITTGGVSQALVVWLNQTIDEVRAVQYNGSWKLIPQVISSDSEGNPSCVATGNNGFATWLDDNLGSVQVTNLNAGSWSYPLFTVSTSNNNESPTISMRTDGTSILVWADYMNGTVDAVFFPNGGTPGALQVISSAGTNTAVQSSTSGLTTLATWQTVSGTDVLIFANIN